MKLYEAKNLIQSVFEHPFDQERYDLFIRNLLKDFEVKPTTYKGNIIPNAFDNYIRKMERLGKFEDEDGHVIDILAVELKREHSIEYARSAQRNFIRWYLGGSRGGQMKDAALAAFYSENSAEWRFSLIKMQYSLEIKKDEITPAKRFSFLVGETGKSHTAQQQLIKLLKSDDIPLLSDLEGAFNVETVTNEFFEKYKALALNLTEELDKIITNDEIVNEEFEIKQIATIDFAKKLLGQIVFLYFLQRKGWLGLKNGEKYGEGNRHFLGSLYLMKQPDENFYNDYLEYLFYEALSKKRVTDEYSRFNCRIPFLNGGLFDPIQFYDWEKTDIIIPDSLFTNNNKTKEGDIGDGILDIFDRYNFTVNEAEPLEKEVAVDPEMLGKVFERMLEVKERKSKGAFYTPREIVHYMSQESLIHYLDTSINDASSSYQGVGKDQIQAFGNETIRDQSELLIEHHRQVNVPKEDLETLIKHGEYFLENEEQVLRQGVETKTYKHKMPESIHKHAKLIDEKLREIRVCDPAVGSGAFPVGVMSEIVKARSILFKLQHPGKEPSHYEFKNHAIHYCLYGVDIDASAVEICKLRLWLSLVVDEQRIDRIEPLPNLDYKIVKGNSLINMPDGVMRDQHLEDEIDQLMKSYYYETNKQAKRDLKNHIDNKIKNLFKSAEQFTNYPIDFDFCLFFHEVYKEKNGFDVVIGNPPYVTKLEHNQIKYFQNFYETIQGKKYDLFRLFIEKGLKLLNKKTLLTYIVPDVIINLKQASNLRKFILKNYTLSFIAVAPTSTFDASVEPVIIGIINSVNKKDKLSKLIDLNKDIVLKSVSQLDWCFGDYNFDFDINTPQNCILRKIKESDKIIKDEMIWKKGLGVYSRQHLLNKFSKGEVDKIMNDKPWTKNSKADDSFGKEIVGKDVTRYRIVWNGKKWLSYGPWLAFQRPIEFFKGDRILVREITSGGYYNVLAAFETKEYFNNQSIFNGILKQNSIYKLSSVLKCH